MSDPPDHVEGTFTAGRLIGVPSYHFDPLFAQVVARALVTFQPSIVAVEMPDGLFGELEWASMCWPGPVAAVSSGELFPFIPGDSIFEAFRLAVLQAIPVALVDLPVATSPSTPPGPIMAGWVGGEFIRAGAGALLETIASLVSATPPLALHDAREAHMARRLSELLAEAETVMWVGGMAHWTNIVRRMKDNDFDSPSVAVTTYSSFRRLRLAPTALYYISGRLPWLVDRFARDPSGYDEHAALRELCLDATGNSGTDASSPSPAGELDETVSALGGPESTNPIDIARTLQYARNLAATGSLRERPSFDELLTSAAACIGVRYAYRLYVLATGDRASAQSLNHDALERHSETGKYVREREILDVEPWTPRLGEVLPPLVEIRRRAQDELYKDLPKGGRKDATTKWECDPDDEDAYIAFVEHALRRASASDPEEPASAPLQVGLRDGLDVRATLRNWAHGKIYVRQERRGHLNFTNGVIDWANISEHSDVLTGKKEGGWIDPDFTRLGSASRETTPFELLQEHPHVQRDYRSFSLVTLDAPTHETAAKALGVKSFWTSVIKPIVDLGDTTQDHLYEWLDIMFQFCAGKPFAYFSMYVPGPEIHRIAWRHRVQVVHIPLHRLPPKMLDRARAFRFLELNRQQWDEFQRRRSARTTTWSNS